MSTERIHQRFTLQAEERLKSRKQIETLFREGEAFPVFPLRMVFSIVPRKTGEISPVRVGFSIPKKRLKKAVQRNTIRRRIKEAWRLQKHDIYRTIPATQQLHCFIIFGGDINFDFTQAQCAVKKAIERLKKIVANNIPEQHD